MPLCDFISFPTKRKKGRVYKREIERYKRWIRLTTELKTDILCPNKHKWQNNLFGHSFPQLFLLHKNIAIMQPTVVANSMTYEWV